MMIRNGESECKVGKSRHLYMLQFFSSVCIQYNLFFTALSRYKLNQFWGPSYKRNGLWVHCFTVIDERGNVEDDKLQIAA